jgi:hypothetical protein
MISSATLDCDDYIALESARQADRIIAVLKLSFNHAVNSQSSPCWEFTDWSKATQSSPPRPR